MLAVTGSVGVGGDSQCKQFTERTHNSVVVEKRRGDEDEEGMLQSTSLRSSLPSLLPMEEAFRVCFTNQLLLDDGKWSSLL